MMDSWKDRGHGSYLLETDLLGMPLHISIPPVDFMYAGTGGRALFVHFAFQGDPYAVAIRKPTTAEQLKLLMPLQIKNYLLEEAIKDGRRM